jgi:hypothetical protein
MSWPLFIDQSNCICQFPSCKKFLENPVSFPCGYTLCKYHLIDPNRIDLYLGKSSVKIDCPICKQEHHLGLNKPNKPISDIGYRINSVIHLDVKPKEIKQNLAKKEIKIIDINHISSGVPLNKILREMDQQLLELQTILREHEINKPDLYIYDYFADIRFKVDEHREEQKKAIDDQSDEIIDRLNSLEKECQANALKLNVGVDLQELKEKSIPDFKDSIRFPKINIEESTQMLEKLKSTISEIKSKFESYKSSLLMNKSFHFVPYLNTFFGSLKEVHQDEIKLKQNSNGTYEGKFFNENMQGFDGTKNHRYIQWIDGKRTGFGIHDYFENIINIERKKEQ